VAPIIGKVPGTPGRFALHTGASRAPRAGFVRPAPFAAYQVQVPTSATYRVTLRRCRSQSPCCASAPTCR
jgi:hypothetical protein